MPGPLLVVKARGRHHVSRRLQPSYQPYYAFQASQSQLQAAAQGYQMETSRRAQEAQRNSQALMQILSQQGQIRGNMGMAQLQAVSGLQSQQVMGHAQMMAEAAKMADQPTFAAGLLGGVASSMAGGMFGAGAEHFFGD